MATQRQVATRFWLSEQVLKARPATRLFMLWAMTHPHSTLAGAFRLNYEAAMEGTGLLRREIARAIEEASRPGPDGEAFLSFDATSRLVWVRKRIQYEFPQGVISQKQREGLRRVLDDLPRCTLLRELCEAHKGLGNPFDTLADTLSKGYAIGTDPALCSLLPASSSLLPTTLAPNGQSPSVPTTQQESVVLTDQGFVVREDVLARWRETYPAVDVGREVRAAFDWLWANPKNRKKNLRRFLVNWLEREQDKAPRAALPRPTEPEREPERENAAREAEALAAWRGANR